MHIMAIDYMGTVRRRHGYKKIVELNAGPAKDDTTRGHHVAIK